MYGAQGGTERIGTHRCQVAQYRNRGRGRGLTLYANSAYGASFGAARARFTQTRTEVGATGAAATG